MSKKKEKTGQMISTHNSQKSKSEQALPLYLAPGTLFM